MNQASSPTGTMQELGAPQIDHTLGLDDPKVSELSGEFVGRWSHLISTTNWEKGRIICEWREALMGSQSSPTTYSDEAWSRRVGGVTGQHVGRLRRVYERFQASYTSFAGLYWSHFLAALDWDDAEMWLEGAVQSKWSVSEMRSTRWTTLGSDPATKPKESDIRSRNDDEDYVPLAEVDESGARNSTADLQDDPDVTSQAGPRYDDPDFGDADYDGGESGSAGDDDDALPWEDSVGSQESPFANLPELPVDLADAFEQFKLAIIRHRSNSWADVSPGDVAKSLDALRAFAMQ